MLFANVRQLFPLSTELLKQCVDRCGSVLWCLYQENAFRYLTKDPSLPACASFDDPQLVCNTHVCMFTRLCCTQGMCIITDRSLSLPACLPVWTYIQRNLIFCPHSIFACLPGGWTWQCLKECVISLALKSCISLKTQRLQTRIASDVGIRRIALRATLPTTCTASITAAVLR